MRKEVLCNNCGLLFYLQKGQKVCPNCGYGKGQKIKIKNGLFTTDGERKDGLEVDVKDWNIRNR